MIERVDYFRSKAIQTISQVIEYWEALVNHYSGHPWLLWSTLSSILNRQPNASNPPLFTAFGYQSAISAKIGRVRADTAGMLKPKFLEAN